jgi:hypothetical protein
MSDQILKTVVTAVIVITVLAVLTLLGLTLLGGNSLKDPTAAPASSISSVEPLRAGLLNKN